MLPPDAGAAKRTPLFANRFLTAYRSNGETKLDETNGGGYAMNSTLMMLVGGLMLVAAAGWVWLKRTK